MSTLSERLKQIRMLNHYTMKEAASCLGITKQSISKYETGKAIPTDEVLEKLMHFYALPARYLTKSPVALEECTQLFYRRNQRTSQRELEEARIRLVWYYEILVECEEFIDIPKADFPHFGNNLSIEEKAEALRDYWGIQHNPISNMAKLVMAHGINVFTTELENHKIDGYSQIIDGYPLIILNQNKGTRERKNFSLAHELGHLILHCGKGTETMDPQQLEREADYFAAFFLLPGEEVKRDIIHVDVKTLRRLGEKWHVSPQAVLERCRSMGLLGLDEEISLAHRQYLLQKLNEEKNYYIPEEEIICSIENVLKDIDSNEEKRSRFLNEVCFPVPMLRMLFQMPNMFAGWEEIPDGADEIEGVQLSFDFENQG